MSENLDLVRSIYVAWGRGDFGSLAWADPEIEYVIVDTPEPGRWTGVAEMATAIRNVLDTWDDARIEADQYRELDGERVLVFNHLSGRGKRSGAEVGRMRRDGAAVLHVRNGKVTRYVSYFHRENALSDLGLSE
jgi:ketosteroid isomerase-like protein